MLEIETEVAVESLIKLEKHYQSRYEHYLAMATGAKENRERVGLLLQDLWRVELPIQNSESAIGRSGGLRVVGLRWLDTIWVRDATPFRTPIAKRSLAD